MIRTGRKTWFLIFSSIVLILVWYFWLTAFSKSEKIKIIYYVVRDRVIPFDQIEMRSTIIVGFRLGSMIESYENLSVYGELYHNGVLISKDTIHKIDGPSGNLGFEVSLAKREISREDAYSIPEGKYTIVINLLNEKKDIIAVTKKELMRGEIARTFKNPEEKYKKARFVLAGNDAGKPVAHSTVNSITSGKQDYVIFQKSTVERVFPKTIPDETDYISEIRTELSRNEFRSVSFSLRAGHDLGKVTVRITPLRGQRNVLKTDMISIKTVGQLTEIVKSDNKNGIFTFRYAPRIIETKDVSIPGNFTQTYWLTLKIDDHIPPGEYRCDIEISPEHDIKKKVPLYVTVLPFTLTDTDIQYGMMMDYAFYELDNRTWTEKDKKLITKSGEAIYRDLRTHGITLVYPHSQFYYKTYDNGEPILNSLRASLESYAKNRFPGPFVWYLGHLLQTAKPKHPGSILGYDEEVAKRRLKYLLQRFEAIAQEYGINKKKLIVQLVDEPDKDQSERIRAGKVLHKIARDMGFKTLITRPWDDVDIICTGIPADDREAERLKKKGKQWWIYPNDALTTTNLIYTRYVFGFGAWRWGVNGVVPWTFQMTQGSNGNPFTVIDGPEVMVAYPGTKGPITTPVWETIRDGINDYKYIYLLQRLIYESKQKGNPAADKIEHSLLELKKNMKYVGISEINQQGYQESALLDKMRKQIIDWSLELYNSTDVTSIKRNQSH